MTKKSMKKLTRNKKGVHYSCNACGLVVSVDNDCGCVDACDIICCGEQMKVKN